MFGLVELPVVRHAPVLALLRHRGVPHQLACALQVDALGLELRGVLVIVIYDEIVDAAPERNLGRLLLGDRDEREGLVDVDVRGIAVEVRDRGVVDDLQLGVQRGDVGLDARELRLEIVALRLVLDRLGDGTEHVLAAIAEAGLFAHERVDVGPAEPSRRDLPDVLAGLKDD